MADSMRCAAPIHMCADKARWQREQVLGGATLSEVEALLARTAALLEAAGLE